MHPRREELRDWLTGDLTDPELTRPIQTHVDECEFCAELCENLRELLADTDLSAIELPADELDRIAETAHRNAMAGAVVPLQLMSLDADDGGEVLLAADGGSTSRPQIKTVATLFSDSPEIVLKVMHDNSTDRYYVDLMSEDPGLAEHVLVELPELNRQFLTDSSGRAELNLEDTSSLDNLKWQVRMPEAVFELEPLKYDPDKVEFATASVLESDRRDRVEFRFERRTEGKLLIIRVLEFAGETDYPGLNVSVSQGNSTSIRPVGPGEPLEIGPITARDTINIRLYRR